MCQFVVQKVLHITSLVFSKIKALVGKTQLTTHSSVGNHDTLITKAKPDLLAIGFSLRQVEGGGRRLCGTDVRSGVRTTHTGIIGHRKGARNCARAQVAG